MPKSTKNRVYKRWLFRVFCSGPKIQDLNSAVFKTVQITCPKSPKMTCFGDPLKAQRLTNGRFYYVKMRKKNLLKNLSPYKPPLDLARVDFPIKFGQNLSEFLAKKRAYSKRRDSGLFSKKVKFRTFLKKH